MKAIQKLFMAALPPADVAQALYDQLSLARTEFPDWFWQEPQRYHITLQYPYEQRKGYVTDFAANLMTEALDGICVDIPMITTGQFFLSGNGNGQSRLGLLFNQNADNALNDLRLQITAKLNRAGFSARIGARMHLTLAKAPDGHATDASSLNGKKMALSPSWLIKEFHVLQVLTGNYQTLTSYDLDLGRKTSLRVSTGVAGSHPVPGV